MNRSRERIHVSFFGEARDAENSLTVAIENDNGGERVYAKVFFQAVRVRDGQRQH